MVYHSMRKPNAMCQVVIIYVCLLYLSWNVNHLFMLLVQLGDSVIFLL